MQGLDHLYLVISTDLPGVKHVMMALSPKPDFHRFMSQSAVAHFVELNTLPSEERQNRSFTFLGMPVSSNIPQSITNKIQQ